MTPITDEMVERAQDWRAIDTAPDNELVMTKIDDARGVRNIQPMIRRSNLWWINLGEPNEMYVYYTPTHWSRATLKTSIGGKEEG